MSKEIYSARGKTYGEMTDEEKIAFVEAVCMVATDVYLKGMGGLSNSSYRFFKERSNRVLDITPCQSKYMDKYLYGVRDNICALSIVDKNGEAIEICEDLDEVKIFVSSAFSTVPHHSPIMNMVRSGMTKQEIVDAGVSEIKKRSRHIRVRSVNPNSKRQQVLRGEITRYEAYEKKDKNKVDG